MLYHNIGVKEIHRQKATPLAQPIQARLDALQKTLNLRAKSLIVTLLGDAIEAHGGALWLGNLIDLAAPFGVNDRLVRTSVLRLSREGWLGARQIGRRSYYELTTIGRQRIRDSERRIYAAPNRNWDGRWRLVLTGQGEIGDAARARLRRELRWLGFGVLGTNVFAHPRLDVEALRNMLDGLGLRDEVVVMQGQAEAPTGFEPTHDLLARAFDLRDLERAYADFVQRFTHFEDETTASAAPTAAYRLRTLMSHEFRRVRLRDPALPDELLPKRWIGGRAWTLARDLYEMLLAPSDAHLRAVAATVAGPLPAPRSTYYERFGGIRPRNGSGVTAAV